MLVKRIACCGWILMLGAILAAAPALAADESDLAARIATWEKEYNAGNLKAVQAMYTTDGCRMPPNEEAVHGGEAILAELKAAKEQGIGKLKLAVTAAETSGDLGYGTGTYEILAADGSHVDQGKWMNVSKKLNGTWKIQCDIWNSDMPIPTGGTE